MPNKKKKPRRPSPPDHELRKKHLLDIEKLTLRTQPLKTLQLFILATVEYLRKSFLYVLRKGSWLVALAILIVAVSTVLLNVDGPHEKHIQEFGNYAIFVLWWVALGVASSIGLGSGLHTFVLYLGPHIAFFTIKAMKCGRVDLKAAPYDTILLKKQPSWLEKDCHEFGPPVYAQLPGSMVKVPISNILPQVQLEAILWGMGTALGELPPYFISRAARLSGNKMETIGEFGDDSEKQGIISTSLRPIKHCLLSHSQYLNFITILLLASIPNPLFDLAGIMCGQFGVPFWEFFFATIIGKAIIKTYLQTFFIISLCNNQLLEWVEHELISVIGLIPGFSSFLPSLVAKLHAVQEKYMSSPVPKPDVPEAPVKHWNLSSIWNMFIWLMLMNFFASIVTSTAQRYLKQQLEITNKKYTSKAKSK